MAFSWFASGATPDYLRMYIWYRESKGKNVKEEYPKSFLGSENSANIDVDIVEEHITLKKKSGEDSQRKVKTKIHHLTEIEGRPAVDVIFDTGSKIFDPKIVEKRIKDGYTPMPVGPYFPASKTPLGEHISDKSSWMYNETFLKHLTLDRNNESWWMASAHYLKPDEEEFCERVGIKMCADSGGAQTKFRTSNYVDPYHVIKIHNACAHTGMALDLATRRDCFTGSDFRVLPKIQKKHNDIFVKEMKAGKILREERGLPPLKLLNVLHGMTRKDFDNWYEAVKDENFSGWAVSLDSDKEDLCIFRGCTVIWEKWGKKDLGEQIHLFGVSGPNMIPVMAWLGNFFSNLTSDSSSWIEGGRRRTYFYNEDGTGKLEDIQLVAGENKKHNSSGRFNLLTNPQKGLNAKKDEDLLPCKCPFCNLMGTWGALRSSEMTYTALVSHNILMIKEVVNFWNSIAIQPGMTLEKYLVEISKGFRDVDEEGRPLDKNKTAVGIKEKVKYLDYAMNHNADEADALFGCPAPKRSNKKRSLGGIDLALDDIKKDENGLLFGLSEIDSNMELIGLHLTDEELGDYLSEEFGFDKAQVIEKLGKKV